MDQLVESLNKFSLETLQRTNTNNKMINTVFSPYSAFVCVAMSAQIFKGQTRVEILKSLQISIDNSQVETVLQQLRKLIDDENTDKVSSSNRIWANEKLDFNPETFAPNEMILGIQMINYFKNKFKKIFSTISMTSKFFPCLFLFYTA